MKYFQVKFVVPEITNIGRKSCVPEGRFNCRLTNLGLVPIKTSFASVSKIWCEKHPCVRGVSKKTKTKTNKTMAEKEVTVKLK